MVKTIIYEGGTKLTESSAPVSDDQDSIQGSSSTFLKISTVFPFVLFPDDLIIDEDKVTIVRRTFFASEEIHTIPIKDIMDVIVSHNIFFATVYIKRAFQSDLYQLNYLKKDEAMRARLLILDLVSRLANDTGEDLTSFETR